jgi:hypothetical protein
VIPVDSPTVPKADTVSNRTASSPNGLMASRVTVDTMTARRGHRDSECLALHRGGQSAAEHVHGGFIADLSERHCCIEAKGVLALHQSSEADP